MLRKQPKYKPTQTILPPIVSTQGESPITSYGVILFTLKDGKIQYLICQRRDSIEYTDFIRGRYSRANLTTYITLMTPEERERILTHDFDELWYDLWVNHESRLFKEIYPKAKQKYAQNYNKAIELIKETNSLTKCPLWGFPKGKKNTREKEINCAIREFGEETKMSIDYKSILNMSPSTELFKGSNGKMYSTSYYIAYIEHDKKKPFNKIELDGIRKETVSEEIGALRWVSLDQSRDYLPKWRIKLLEETQRRIMMKLKPDPHSFLK
jgi:8-oxo-dGTP pyrophosphatase MutT (NUDIX family)